jgi:amidase
MTGFAEYDQFDALGLAELIQKGEVSAQQLLEEAIRRRDASNPKLNAIIHNMDELAYQAIGAGLPDGPFRGVPFLLKDLLGAYKGVPMTNGCRAYRDFIPDYDSEMVVRFKRAGLVIFGKTNCPENGYVGTTEPLLHGITRNPWNLDRTAGGSSGGSGAAVSARIVPMASGGDGGGSLRIPGSCCALVGLKPSRGRNPYGPGGGEPWFGQVQEGVLSVSVRDTAAALDATSGPDMGCPSSAPPPARPFLEEVSCDPGTLKIAWSAEPLVREGAIDTECADALLRTVEQLKSVGHELVEITPPVDRRILGEGHLLRMMCAAAADIRAARHVLGRAITPDDFEPETWLIARFGESLSAALLETVSRELHGQRYIFEQFMQPYDVYLTPTLAKPPVAHGEYRLQGVEKLAARLARHTGLGPLTRALPALMPGLIEKNFDWVAATPVFNITGNPSVSLPLQWSTDGLPIGMMFTARALDDACLLRLAGQLERELPWAHKRPAQTS